MTSTSEITPSTPGPSRASEQLGQWLAGDGEKTLGALIDAFGRSSFALLLVLLMAIPALPAPTAGLTHVFEVIAALLCLQLIAGVRRIWLPDRWRRMVIGGERQQKLIASLSRLIARLERYSRPRLRFIFGHRASEVVYGLIALVGVAGAFFAPPFSGLDTLPSLGVVVLSIAVILQDALIAVAGVLLIIAGVALEIVLGGAALHAVGSLF